MTKRKKDELGVIENEEEVAAELVTLLEPNSVAWQAIRYLKESEMYASGGLTILWKKVDERFPLKTAMDKLGEKLDELFSLRPRPGESTSGFTGRVKGVFSAVAAADEEAKIKAGPLKQQQLSPCELNLAVDTVYRVRMKIYSITRSPETAEEVD